MLELERRLAEALGAQYDVSRHLGRGGMADVFLATDRRHGRRVAIKVLRPHFDESIALDRFRREIEIVARLHHPHILPLYDSGDVGDLHYYIMPFVEQESLRDRLSREKVLPVDEALRLTIEIADALAYAHAASVVHRDIKPGNILLVAGHAVVADFGVALARSAASDVRLTGSGSSIGTPIYMSPEQAAGDDQVDARTDIYSLASVLYELLIGEPPFTARNAQALLARKCMEDAPRSRASRADVPVAVDDALSRALAREPRDRFSTADEFARALGAAGGLLATGAVSTTIRASRSDAPIAGDGGLLRAVAVLPFQSLSDDRDDEFLTDGLTDELILALSRVRGLRVVARTTAFTFKGQATDARAVGARLNVGAILNGTLRRSGTQLRIVAHLVDVETGFDVWSERFDRTVGDVFVVQDEIARAIVDAFDVELVGRTAIGPRALVAVPTRNMAAYDRYLEGRFHWNSRTEPGLRRSVECLRRALELDPGFALASAALAQSLATMAIYGVLPPHDVMPRAREAAEYAIERDPTLADALSARGCVTAIYDWQWSAAHIDFSRAITLAPHSPGARHWYAMHALAPRARFDAAREQLRYARSLDPLSPVIGASLGLISLLERDYEGAIAACTAALALDVRFPLTHYFLGQALTHHARFTEGIAALERAVEASDGSSETIAALGAAFALAGDTSRARGAVAELETRSSGAWVSPVLVAQIHTALGDREQALTALERASDARAADLVWLGVRPIFDPLRDEPRFARILATLALDG